VNTYEEWWWEAELYRLLGEILIRQGCATKDEIESVGLLAQFED